MVSILFKSDGGTNIYPVACINIAICSIVFLGDIFSYIFYMNLDLLPLMRSNYRSRRRFLSKPEPILYKEPFLHIFASWCNESVGNFHSLSKPVFRKCGLLIVQTQIARLLFNWHLYNVFP